MLQAASECFSLTSVESVCLKSFVCGCSCGHELDVPGLVLWQDDGQRISGGRLWSEYWTYTLTQVLLIV